jgi:DNA-binding phage protein
VLAAWRHSSQRLDEVKRYALFNSIVLLEDHEMTDPLVLALERLVAREGGRINVADEIGVNEQSLYQILKRIPHSTTGKPKGIGPKIRAKLNARYPDWMELGRPTPYSSVGKPDEAQTALRVSENIDLIPFVSSSKTSARAPVVAWARLGDVVFKEEIEMGGERLAYTPMGETSDRVILAPVVDDALAPRLTVGDLVAIDLDNKQPERGQVTLFRSTSDGAFFLRRYQPLAHPHFEALDAKHGALDSQRHGLEVVGVRCGVRLADI